MQYSDIIALAQRAIKSNRLRANLTVAIIAIGITALIGIITVIEVLKGSIHSNFSSMGSNTFSINTQAIRSGGGGGGRRKHRQAHSEEENRIKLNEAKAFVSRYSFPAKQSISLVASSAAILKRNTKKSNPNIIVLATDENYLDVSGTSLSAGRNFNALDISSGTNTCILGHAIATKFFDNPLDAVNGFIHVGAARYRILGVMESKGASFINRMDNMVIVTLANARSQFSIASKSCVISIHIPDLKYMNYAIDEAEGVMRTIRKLHVDEGNNFSIASNDEVANSLISNLKYVTLSASIIGLITLLGAAIGLMNIMLVSVAERTREIGLTKAVGATNKTIRTQFLLEAIIISVKGGIIGIVIGILIGNILSLVFGSPFVIPYLWILLGITICIVVGLLAGIYPALKASKLNPINALRYE